MQIKGDKQLAQLTDSVQHMSDKLMISEKIEGEGIYNKQCKRGS